MDTETEQVTCPYCGKPALQVGGDVLYPHRPDLYCKRFYRCAPCDAYVGCPPDGRPFGRLANASLRQARKDAHAIFDRVWKQTTLKRSEAYDWLAKALDIPVEQCHIGMFDEAMCRKVVELRALVSEKILDELELEEALSWEEGEAAEKATEETVDDEGRSSRTF